MGKKIEFSNYRVEVTVAERSVIRIGQKQTEHEIRLRDARLVADSIKRHIDDFEDVTVECDAAPVCEHCGYAWGEEGDTFNEGCCDKDLEGAPEGWEP